MPAEMTPVETAVTAYDPVAYAEVSQFYNPELTRADRLAMFRLFRYLGGLQAMAAVNPIAFDRVYGSLTTVQLLGMTEAL